MDSEQIVKLVEAMRSAQNVEQGTQFEGAKTKSHFLLAAWSNDNGTDKQRGTGVASYGIMERSTPEDYIASIQVRAQAAAYALVGVLDAIAEDKRLPAPFRETLMNVALDSFLGQMGNNGALFERSITRVVDKPNPPTA